MFARFIQILFVPLYCCKGDTDKAVCLLTAGGTKRGKSTQSTLEVLALPHDTKVQIKNDNS